MSNNTLILLAPAKVDVGTFTGIQWAGTAFSMLFVVSRIYIRAKTFHMLFIDDLLVFLAWLMLLANTIVWHCNNDALYLEIAVASGQLSPAPPNFDQTAERYLRGAAAALVLFYSSLWSVKLSFLFFFKRLGHNVKGQKILWWCVFIITVALYVASYSGITFQCLVQPFATVQADCQNLSEYQTQKENIRYTTAFDVLTDALIMVIPVSMLWKARITLRQKLALSGIFSLTIVIMVLAIIRAGSTIDYSPEIDTTLLFMWNSVEQTVAIIVACLASFRALFVNQDAPTGVVDDSYTWEKMSDSTRTRRSTIGLGGAGQHFSCTSSSNEPDSWLHIEADEESGKKTFVPPDRVHVRQEVVLSSAVREEVESPVIDEYHTHLANGYSK